MANGNKDRCMEGVSFIGKTDQIMMVNISTGVNMEKELFILPTEIVM